MVFAWDPRWSAFAAYWAPALSSTLVGGGIGALASVYINSLIERRIAMQLETLKASLRLNEEQFKRDLQARDSEIAALRSGALSNLQSRNSLLDQRRLQAAEVLWSSVVSLDKFKSTARFTQTLNIDDLMKTATKGDARARKSIELADTIWKMGGLDDLAGLAQDHPESQKQRLFVQPAARALYMAYRQAVFFPVMQLVILRTGAGPNLLADPSAMLNLIKTALPHLSSFIDEHGTSSVSFILDDLQEKLFDQIAASTQDWNSDQDTINRSQKILSAANAVAASIKTGGSAIAVDG